MWKFACLWKRYFPPKSQSYAEVFEEMGRDKTQVKEELKQVQNILRKERDDALVQKGLGGSDILKSILQKWNLAECLVQRGGKAKRQCGEGCILGVRETRRNDTTLIEAGMPWVCCWSSRNRPQIFWKKLNSGRTGDAPLKDLQNYAKLTEPKGMSLLASS